MKTIKGIFVHPDHYQTRECNAILQGNNLAANTLPVRRGSSSRELIDSGEDHFRWLHIGSVEFVEGAFNGTPFRPDFYPEWTRDHWHRRIKTQRVFVKSARSYKRFPPFVDELHVSDPVVFVDEWRHYVINGQSRCSWWYTGEKDDCEKDPNGPPLPFEIPFPDWCGSVDIGRLATGELALVECHHPYAIGWYGEMKDSPDYYDFMLAGWEYLVTAYQASLCRTGGQV